LRPFWEQRCCPAGGAAVLASYLKAAQAQAKDGAFIVHAVDFVGASPPSSALLQDEPSISFLNVLANSECSYDVKIGGVALNPSRHTA